MLHLILYVIAIVTLIVLAFQAGSTLGLICSMVLGVISLIVIPLMLLRIVLSSGTIAPVKMRKSKKCIYFECDTNTGYDGPHGDDIARRVYIYSSVKHLNKLSNDWECEKRVWKAVDYNGEEIEYSSYEEARKLPVDVPDIRLTEYRKNGAVIEYQEIWGGMSYFVEHDIVRLLFDEDYYQEVLAKADNGNADLQYLLGCCYAYCGANTNTIKQDEEKALYWWQKSAEQENRMAYRALAFFAFLHKEYEKARQLAEQYDLHEYVIERYCSTCRTCQQ